MRASDLDHTQGGEQLGCLDIGNGALAQRAEDVRFEALDCVHTIARNAAFCLLLDIFARHGLKARRARGLIGRPTVGKPSFERIALLSRFSKRDAGISAE